MKIKLIKKPLLLVWLIFTAGLTGVYYKQLVGNDKENFLPGSATDGHYQIISDCNLCHGDGFEDTEIIQKSCVSCHGKELKAINDSHPKKKFTDPRNADRIEIIDARICITCHIEHQPNRTRAMGVTLPDDFCVLCHDDVAENRKSHEGVEFETCASSGCHNYHDNKALYEEFLVKNMEAPAQLSRQVVVSKSLKNYFTELDASYSQSLTLEQQDSPEQQIDPKVLMQWHSSDHAEAGVNCSDCHAPENQWSYHVPMEVCESCHRLELQGFKAGKHGMKLTTGEQTIRVSESRLVGVTKKDKKKIDCQSCHADHSYNTEYAAIDACLTCHRDEHTKNYKKSKHYVTWLNYKNGSLSSEHAVTCATCHLPRKTVTEKGIERTLVQHNQNENLEPNEKMARSVCMNCHGLKFTLESLADTGLIKSNFEGQPALENEGFEMAKQREIQQKLKKKEGKKTDEN